jgi:DNA invertase Pin-like site-specific DNA recombinase
VFGLADVFSTIIGMRLIGYIRVSRVAGRGGESFISPTLQREPIEAHAAAHGHTVVDWQEDLDQPGSRYERPGFQRALEAVEAGEADGICVARLDRFARSVADAARAVERLEAAKGSLVAIDLGMDTSTSGGRLMRNVLMALAEFELERVRESWAAAGSHAAERGVHVCKVAPVGYRKDADGRLEPDPDTAPVVRELFQRRGAGESWVSLMAFLDERLPRENGTHWSKSTVMGTIGRRTYLGEARGGGVVNADAHPPLVTRGEFEAAQQAKADGRHDRGGSLLAGLLRCASCGHTLTPMANGARGYKYYKCRKLYGDGICEAPTAISTRRADGYIEREFLAAVEAEPVAATGNPADGSIEQALAALEAAERELSEYRDANLISVIGAEAFTGGLRRRQEAVDEARRNLGEANAVSPLAGIRDLRSVWPDLDVRERRHLLASVLERAVVAPAPGAGKGAAVEDRVELVWR